MTCKVIIPIYRQPNADEARAMRHNRELLSKWPHAIIAPEDLALEGIEQICPETEIIRVSDEWLGRRNGIAGYNRMMFSEAFYRMFEGYDYILICHNDAWIFRDELAEWLDKGYDCVAAPWVRRRVYNLPIIKQYMALRAWAKHRKGEKCRADLYGKIGNGGLSLRKVESFASACRKYNNEIEQAFSQGGHLNNEDVFWATVPQEFRYPEWQEALGFAIDTNPKYCYNLRQQQLPMGCHSWSKPRMWKFWKDIIKKE